MGWTRAGLRWVAGFGMDDGWMDRRIGGWMYGWMDDLAFWRVCFRMDYGLPWLVGWLVGGYVSTDLAVL